MVEDIVTQNIGLLHSGVHRVVVMLAVVGVVLGAVFLFLGWNFHQEGSLLRQSVYTVVFLALWFLALKLFQLHKSAVIDLKALMQFQESRIDTLKVSLALRDKAIQEMESKLRRLEQDQEGNGGEEKQDYRKLSGLS